MAFWTKLLNKKPIPTISIELHTTEQEVIWTIGWLNNTVLNNIQLNILEIEQNLDWTWNNWTKINWTIYQLNIEQAQLNKLNCGLDSLWLGSNLTSLRPGGQVATPRASGLRPPRARVKIYYNPHPYGLDSLWLGPIMIIILHKIVEWSIEQNHVQLTLFNTLFGQFKSVQWKNCAIEIWGIGICSSSVLFNWLLGQSVFWANGFWQIDHLFK